MCGYRKYSDPPLWKVIRNFKGGGCQQPKFVRESMKLNWKFQMVETVKIKSSPWIGQV